VKACKKKLPKAAGGADESPAPANVKVCIDAFQGLTDSRINVAFKLAATSDKPDKPEDYEGPFLCAMNAPEKFIGVGGLLAHVQLAGCLMEGKQNNAGCVDLLLDLIDFTHFQFVK